ncbi:MAG: hypothetical protein ABIS14_12710 [Sphingomonas sp.]
MNAPAFDTLALAQRLTAAGLPRDVANALSSAMADVAMRDVATKADLRDAVHTLTVRGFAGLTTLAGILAGAFALFH